MKDRLDGPRVAYVTAGGAGMFCGSCMQDNTLARALVDRGYPITLIPTFTPITVDEENVSEERVFLGGINLYLQQKWPWLARLPRPLRRLLDHPAVLGRLRRNSRKHQAREEGELAISLLKGSDGPQRAETDELARWIADDLQPELVMLTNLIVSGFVPELKRRRDVPVVVMLQGDDIFLDALEPDVRERVRREMARVGREIDAFFVNSGYYRDAMAELFELPAERFHVVPLGLAEPHRFHRQREPQERPTIGYLARICPEKGFHRMVDAFLQLRELPGMEGVRLRAGGWLGSTNLDYYEAELRRLEAAGARDAYERVDLPDRESKIDFLHTIDLLSVPTVYEECKGLYVLEALAAGVPVVQPAHGAFPELLEATGGGRLVPPGDSAALAEAMRELLLDRDARERLGAEGRARVTSNMDDAAMARRTVEAWRRLLA